MDIDSKEYHDLEQKLEIAKNLLSSCLPYVEYHYERSAVGYGKESKRLIEMIKKFIED